MAISTIHFSHSGSGGASRAMRRAHKACEAVGVASSVAFVHGERVETSDIQLDPSVTADLTERGLREAFQRLQWSGIPSWRTPLSNTLLSVAYPGVDVRRHAIFESSDILHLHWTPWGITPRAIGEWLRSGRPVVWTLHDCWPFTGGCHYPAGCRQFESACLKCPQLVDQWSVVPNSFAEKMAAYHGPELCVVTPSRWLQDQVRASAILGRARVHAIPNPIETDLFSPRPDRDALRAAFGVGARDLAILFGSADHSEQRKGVRLLVQVLRDQGFRDELMSQLSAGGRIVLLMFGAADEVADIPGVTTLNFGTITDDEILADILCLADVTCTPSLEDNYPNVLVESQACGTPCIGFDVGGIGEIINDGVTGLLAPEVGNASALARALLRFAGQHLGDRAMREACRQETVSRNSLERIGAQFSDLYADLLTDKGKAATGSASPLRERAVQAFARSSTRPDVSPGAELLQFPLNYYLADQDASKASAALQPQTWSEAAPAAVRLLAVRTHHAHHSARSGPYQYLRHLPPAYAISHVATPLGDQLAGPLAPTYRAAGGALGATAFGQQGNAWLAELEVMAQCAGTPTDLVHYIDGELGGWLVPAISDQMFARGRRPAFVATFHQPPDLLSGMVNPSALQHLDAVVVLCSGVKRHLAEYLPEERIHVIPHGIDTDFFSPRPKRQPLARRALRILAVGHWLRDFDTALQAFAELRRRGLEAEFIIVSHNLPFSELPPGVRVLKGLTDDQLREAYRNCDVLFLPLQDATANNAILEAMACGLPVVSTDVGGVPEATAGAALLCAPGDASGMADALVNLHGDEALRDRLAQAGRARAEALDWREVAQAHERLYTHLMSRRAGLAA